MATVLSAPQSVNSLLPGEQPNALDASMVGATCRLSLGRAQPAAHASSESIEAVVWAAVASVAGKHASRDSLAAGSESHVTLTILGTVDGHAVEKTFDGDLNVGRDGVRNSTANPEPAKVLAYVLSKVNAATRDAILRDLPAEFAANKCNLPSLPVGLVEQAEGLLKTLRAAKKSPVRGAVQYHINSDDSPLLSVVG